ncbi:MAG: PAS domain-containing protein [Gammaproteobacteria bacterium]|jgi:PAS domain S-box-containing protein
MNGPTYENSTDKIKKIISLIPGHVYYKDIDGVFVWCNDAQLHDLGLTLEEYIGKTDFDLFPKDQADSLRNNDLNVMRSGVPQFFEEPLYDKDGKLITYLSQKIPLKDASGSIVGLLGISLDITEMKNKEIKLEKQNEEKEIALENIINNLPGHVYWKDKNFAFLGCNEKQFKSAGFSSQAEIIGKTDYDLPWREDADDLRKTDLKVITTGEVVTSEEPSTLSDGTAAIFLSKKIPLRNKENNIVGILGISFDITAEKEAEKLRLEKSVIEEREATTKLIAASMAHELRTPLSTIEVGLEAMTHIFPGLLETYQMAKQSGMQVPFINPMQLKAFSNIVKNSKMEARSALSVIDMLLVTTNTSAIDTSKFKTLSMGQCLADALHRYPLHEDETKLIHWKKCDFNFLGDDILFTHVIFNLLKNALYYLKAANKGEIFIWCEQTEKFNILHFKDTGFGMDKEVLDHIFERFFTRTRHGSGVGLAFCKLVMKSFGGDITCDSVKGEFTDFTLTFPR